MSPLASYPETGKGFFKTTTNPSTASLIKLGNGIGVKIVGGQAMPNLYDKVNRCIVTSGAFVTEVFQNSSVYFKGELHEGKCTCFHKVKF